MSAEKAGTRSQGDLGPPRTQAKRHHGIAEGAVAWESSSSGSVPRAATDLLCDLGGPVPSLNPNSLIC